VKNMEDRDMNLRRKRRCDLDRWRKNKRLGKRLANFGLPVFAAAIPAIADLRALFASLSLAVREVGHAFATVWQSLGTAAVHEPQTAVSLAELRELAGGDGAALDASCVRFTAEGGVILN